MYRILSKISDTLIVRTPKYVIFYVLIAPDSRDSPLSNYNRTVLYTCARTRAHAECLAREVVRCFRSTIRSDSKLSR